MNFYFNFQGCQIQYIRVAISQKANNIDLPDIPENLHYVTIVNAMILLVLGDFWPLDDFWVEVFKHCYENLQPSMRFLQPNLWSGLPGNGLPLLRQLRAPGEVRARSADDTFRHAAPGNFLSLCGRPGGAPDTQSGPGPGPGYNGIVIRFTSIWS